MYFFYDVAIRAQLAIFFAEPRQLLTLRGRETRAALRAIGARALDPVAQGGFGQIEIAGDGRNRLAVLEDQADRLGFELVVKLPARPALGGVCHRSGHRIHLSEDVHETGSIPTCARSPMTRRGNKRSAETTSVRVCWPKRNRWRVSSTGWAGS